MTWLEELVRSERAVREAARREGLRAAFERLSVASDVRGRDPSGMGGAPWQGGRALAVERTAIYSGIVAEWAEAEQRRFGYDRPFAVVALGGTGRGEMAPYSDNDFAFLFDDALEGNPFLIELQRQVVHSEEFRERCGFSCLALPFSLDDVPSLGGKQLNSFLDLRPVHDPSGLAGLFRERIRATYDPFEHFLHLRGFWKERWEAAAAASERLDRLDLKHDALRVFLAGIWTLGGREFRPSLEVYTAIEDVRDLEAYEFLLRLRAWVHLARPRVSGRWGEGSGAGGQHPEDVLTLEDVTGFGSWLGSGAGEREQFEFANDVRARLVSARRRVAQFARGVVERELKDGRRVGPMSPLVFGLGGLAIAAPGGRLGEGGSGVAGVASPEGTGNEGGVGRGRERSRAALSLLLAAQRYGVPIDPSELHGTFRQAGDWLEPGPELAAMFLEPRGRLAESLGFLAQVDGAMERLFPGHGRFEAALDPRSPDGGATLRGALARRKLAALDDMVQGGRAVLARAGSGVPGARGVSPGMEAALLDAGQLAAVRLALLTKRLPVTAADEAARADEGRPWAARFSSGFSGLPLGEYYERFAVAGGFPVEVVRLTEFLVAQRSVFKERARGGINDAVAIEEFARLCGEESRLRALFVFACADRSDGASERTDPARWFNTRELYVKTLRRLRAAGEPGLGEGEGAGAPGAESNPARLLAAAGYSPEQLGILRDFGEDFFGGMYRVHAIRFGGHLVRLAEGGEEVSPKVSILPDGGSTIVGVAARDYRGLAATITGALWHRDVDLRQAHLFSAAQHRLALDFFHVAPRDQPLPADVLRFVEGAIRERRYLAPEDEAAVPRLAGEASLREWRHGLHCLRFETGAAAGGLVYALTYRVFRHLQGDIFALSAHAARGRAYVSVYHRLPPDLDVASAREIVARTFAVPVAPS